MVGHASGRGQRRRGRASLAHVLPAACLSLCAAGGAAAEPDLQPPVAIATRPPAGDAAEIDRELGDIQLVVDAAHFRTALALCDSLRPLLEAAGGADALGPRWARLEVMVATAELALGERSRARQALARARQAWPGLVLDERRFSPRLVALWREAPRAGQGTGTEP